MVVAPRRLAAAFDAELAAVAASAVAVPPPVPHAQSRSDAELGILAGQPVATPVAAAAVATPVALDTEKMAVVAAAAKAGSSELHEDSHAPEKRLHEGQMMEMA